MHLISKCEITSYGKVVTLYYQYTLNFFPSKCLISKLVPVRASNKLIFFSINKSAPYLVNSLCFSIKIIIFAKYFKKIGFL